MKAVKIISTIIAWLGLLVVLIGTLPGLIQIPKYFEGFKGLPHFSPYPLMQFGLELMVFLTSVGTVFALIGGLIARPRYLWQCLTAVGGISIVAILTELAYYQYYYERKDILPTFAYMIPFLPGFICITLGITIWYLRKRQNQRTY